MNHRTEKKHGIKQMKKKTSGNARSKKKVGYKEKIARTRGGTLNGLSNQQNQKLDGALRCNKKERRKTCLQSRGRDAGEF